MLKRVMFLFVVLLALMSGTAMAAQGGEPKAPSLDEQLAAFSERYELTGDQASAVRPLMEENRRELQSLFSSMKDADGRMEKFSIMRDIRKEQDEYHDALAEVLSEEQMRRYDESVAKRRQAMKERARTRKKE